VRVRIPRRWSRPCSGQGRLVGSNCSLLPESQSHVCPNVGRASLAFIRARRGRGRDRGREVVCLKS
jgi:hypothetical protein